MYHDCIVGYWQHGTPSGREDHANHMLYAQPSSWFVEYDQFEYMKPLIVDAYKLLGPLHENTAHSAMVDHQVLSDDFMTQKSAFDNGTQVWVNYGLTTFESEGSSIPAKGFRIVMNGKEVTTGAFYRNYFLHK